MRTLFTKMTCTLLLAAGTLGACAETQLTYRGRMTNRAGGTVVQEFNVTFNLYEAEKGGASVWGYTATVKPDTNGSFQVSLCDSVAKNAQLVAGATLTNVLQTGRAQYLGITVGNARELSPREAINATPRVQYAARAQGLAAGATTGTLTAEMLTAADVKLAQAATVTQRLSFGPQATSTPIAVVLDEQAFAMRSLRVKGAGVMPIWGEWEKAAESCMTGNRLLAPVSGVYFISSLNHCPQTNSQLGSYRQLDTAQQGWYAPGLVFFGKAGVTYELPHLGQYAYIGTTGESSSAITVLYRPFNIQ